MFTKWLRMIVFLGVVPAWAVASDGPRVIIPFPPATGPSESDQAVVNDALASTATARDEAIAAHAELYKAQVELMRVTRELWSVAATDRDLVEAHQALAAATVAYQELATPIHAALSQQPDYRAACEALARAQQASIQTRARAEAFTEERVAAAQSVLYAKAVLTKLENDALCSNPDVIAAKERCAAAALHLREVRAALVQSMHQQPAYVAAQHALDEATDKAALADQQLATANAKLFAAQKKFAEQMATRDRLNYWSWTHGLPQPE